MKNLDPRMASRTNKIMRKCVISLLACAAMQAAFAQEVEELKLGRESIAMALTSPEGWVQGYLAEDEAQALQLVTKSSSPVLMRVTVVQRYEQPGCGRLQVDLKQENVPLKDFSTITFVAPPVQFNACADGDPPEKTVDVTQATREAQSRSQRELQAGER